MQRMPAIRLRPIILVTAGALLLAGCADSELNAQVSRMSPIRQMDEFFGYKPPATAPAPRYNPPPNIPPAAFGPGYAPAYPPYEASGQGNL